MWRLTSKNVKKKFSSLSIIYFLSPPPPPQVISSVYGNLITVDWFALEELYGTIHELLIF